MFSELNTPQKVIFWIGFAFSVVSAFVITFVSYVMITTRKPETLGVTYATTLNTSTGEKPICEVEIWSNENNNGQQMYEIQWNSYTDSEGNGVKGFGLQIIGDYELFETSENVNLSKLALGNYTIMNNSFFDGNSYFYFTDDNNVSSYSLSIDEVDSKVKDCLYISILDTFYRLDLNTYEKQERKTDVLSGIISLFGGNRYETKTYKYSWYSLADYIIQSSVKDSARADYEKFYINYLDCADYYSLLQYNGRQYVPLPDTTHLRNYLQVEITYHKDGIQSYADSMFGQVANSVTWNYDDGTNAKDFWTSTDTVKITEGMCNFIQKNDGYYLTIDTDFVSFLNSISNVKYVVNINLDNVDYNVVGIDVLNFSNLKLGNDPKITITATSSKQFSILNNLSNISVELGGGLYA